MQVKVRHIVALNAYLADAMSFFLKIMSGAHPVRAANRDV